MQRDRLATLAAMTDAWAADLTNGHDSTLLAWRRADVIDLNRLARAKWDGLGRLRGHDVEVSPGRHYAIGDELVALAPNPDVGIVTSERLTVTAIDQTHLSARTSLGHTVLITGEGLDDEHLDHGYAITVHRAQGATVDRAHVLAAGGGRELAYVALSRARDQTRVYATADGLDQAVEDLRADWNESRHQRWISDTSARPEPGAVVSDQDPTIVRATTTTMDPARRLGMLTDDHQDLQGGAGRWTDTPAGAAARRRNQARAELDIARRDAQNPNLRRRDRRAAAKTIDTLAAAHLHAEQRWQDVGEPTAEHLRAQITTTRRALEHQRVTEARRSLDRYVSSSLPAPSIDQERDLGIGL